MNKEAETPNLGLLVGIIGVLLCGHFFEPELCAGALAFLELEEAFLLCCGLTDFAAAPSELNWEYIWQRQAELGVPYAMGSGLLIGIALLITARLGVEKYRRRLTMQTLLTNNVKAYPCIAPILNWGRSLLAEPADAGPWMCARQPIQFVADHGLLFDAEQKVIKRELILDQDNLGRSDSELLQKEGSAKFDRKKAEEVFASQLGPKFTGHQDLPGYQKALACAFLLFAKGKRKVAEKILDTMSLSFRPPSRHRWRFDWQPPFVHRVGSPCYTLETKLAMTDCEIDALFAWALEQPEIRAHNCYTYLLLYAMYAKARSTGVLTTSQFIWLRPVNRVLFYLCNNYGRRTVWVEVAGLVAHYEAEEALRKRDAAFVAQDLEEHVVVEAAVNALELALFEEGWISEVENAVQMERYA